METYVWFFWVAFQEKDRISRKNLGGVRPTQKSAPTVIPASAAADFQRGPRQGDPPSSRQQAVAATAVAAAAVAWSSPPLAPLSDGEQVRLKGIKKKVRPFPFVFTTNRGSHEEETHHYQRRQGHHPPRRGRAQHPHRLGEQRVSASTRTYQLVYGRRSQAFQCSEAAHPAGTDRMKRNHLNERQQTNISVP